MRKLLICLQQFYLELFEAEATPPDPISLGSPSIYLTGDITSLFT